MPYIGVEGIPIGLTERLQGIFIMHIGPVPGGQNDRPMRGGKASRGGMPLGFFVATHRSGNDRRDDGGRQCTTALAGAHVGVGDEIGVAIEKCPANVIVARGKLN